MPLFTARKVDVAQALRRGVEGLGFAYRPDSESELERFDISPWFQSPLPPTKSALDPNIAKPTIYPEFDSGIDPNVLQVINYDSSGMKAVLPPQGELERLAAANPIVSAGLVIGLIWLIQR
jgi:hypothetical protein